MRKKDFRIFIYIYYYQFIIDFFSVHNNVRRDGVLGPCITHACLNLFGTTPFVDIISDFGDSRIRSVPLKCVRLYVCFLLSSIQSSSSMAVS